MMMPSNAAASLRRKRPIVIMLVLLVVSVLITAFVTWNALLIQSGVRAFVHGEGLWSKGQQRSVFYAELYAESGSPADLQLAREAALPILQDLGVRYIQGFAIHHPEPFEDLLTNLQQPPTTARFMRIPPHKITVY